MKRYGSVAPCPQRTRLRRMVQTADCFLPHHPVPPFVEGPHGPLLKSLHILLRSRLQRCSNGSFARETRSNSIPLRFPRKRSECNREAVDLACLGQELSPVCGGFDDPYASPRILAGRSSPQEGVSRGLAFGRNTLQLAAWHRR